MAHLVFSPTPCCRKDTVELESCESAGNENPVEYVLTAVMKLPGKTRNRVGVEAIITADVDDGTLFASGLGRVCSQTIRFLRGQFGSYLNN